MRPKGTPKTGGRQKGTPNKVNQTLKEMILGALDGVGGEAYLQQQAIENPGPFLTLVGKVLPMQVTGDMGITVQVTRFADDTPPRE